MAPRPIARTSGVTTLSRITMRSRSSSVSFWPRSWRRSTESTAADGLRIVSFMPLAKAVRNAVTADGFSAANFVFTMIVLP